MSTRGGDSQQVKWAESHTGQGFDPVPRTPIEYIYKNQGSWNQLDQEKSQEKIGELVEAFRFCEHAGHVEMVCEGERDEVVISAIAKSPTNRQQQLWAWWQEIQGGVVAGAV